MNVAGADRLVAATLVLFLAATALFFTRFPTWSWPGGDARDYANITEALVVDGGFDLRNVSYPERRANDKTVIYHDDGALYSIFPIGWPIVQAPAFALGRALRDRLEDRRSRLFVETLAFGLTPALLYGLTGGLLYLLLRRYFEYSVAWSLFGIFVYAFATIAFSFSKHNGVEPLQTFLIAWLVYALLLPSRWSSASAAFSFGLLVLAKPTSAVALPVAVYLYLRNRIWQLSSWPWRLAAVAIGLGFAAFFFYYNGVRGGDPLAAYPTAKEASEFTLSKVGPTLWPLLFGPDRNVFLNNPIYFLAIPGFFLLRDHVYATAALGLWACVLLMYGSSGHYFWGSYVGNARYVVPICFLLLPPALATMRRVAAVRSSSLRLSLWAAVGCLLVSSFYVQVLFASFSEFHVKQYERRYNKLAPRLELPKLEESKHQLRFAHHLFWLTHGKKPDDLEAFPYPSPEPQQAAFAARVLETQFSPDFFRKDYLFLNASWFESVRFFAGVRAMVASLAIAGLFALGLAGRRAQALDLDWAAASEANAKQDQP